MISETNLVPCTKSGCENFHDGTFGAGKFCSRACSCSRGTRSKETREKISKALGGIGKQERICKVCLNKFEIRKTRELTRQFCSQKCASSVQWKGVFVPLSIFDCSSRTVTKILRRLEKMHCSRCSWNEGSCDVHHIRGRKIDDPHQHSNLTVICPNCHRLAHEGKITPEELVNLDEFIGDAWKQAYYG